MQKILLAIWGGCCAALLFGCVSVPQNLLDGIKADQFYKRDMRIEVNGIEGEGVMVLPRAEKYDFKLKAKGRLDLLTFETCHRVITREKAWESGLFKSKDEADIQYDPVEGIEVGDGACPIRIGGYEQKRGRHSWAFIDFEDDSMTMPAILRCAGSDRIWNGVGACQSRVGTIQEIVFSSPMFVSKKTSCKPLECYQGDCSRFRYDMPKGECIYRFKEDSAEGREFRLTTVGFEGILIRED